MGDSQHQYCASGGPDEVCPGTFSAEGQKRQDDWTDHRSQHTKGHGAPEFCPLHSNSAGRDPPRRHADGETAGDGRGKTGVAQAWAVHITE